MGVKHCIMLMGGLMIAKWPHAQNFSLVDTQNTGAQIGIDRQAALLVCADFNRGGRLN